MRGRNDFTIRLAQRRAGLEQIRDYVLLYGAYGKCEALYEIDRTTAAVGITACCRPRALRLRPPGHRLGHLHRRRALADRHRPGTRQDHAPAPHRDPVATSVLRAAVLDPARHFAAFDLENTLIASNVVETYAWLATRRLDTPQRVRFALRTLAETPGLWRRDRRDRTDFLRYFYRRYRGASVGQLDADAAEMLSHLFLTKAIPGGPATGA